MSGTVNQKLEELGNRIHFTRVNLELRQEDLAAKAAVGVNTIARAEAGKPVRTDVLVRIMDALGSEVGNIYDALPAVIVSPIALQALKRNMPKRVRGGRR